MKTLLMRVLVAVTALSMLGTGVAYAQEEGPEHPRARAAGVVTSVQPDAGVFTIETREGNALRIRTDEHTVFRSRDGEVNGIEDLEEGMHVAVAGTAGPDGSLLARVVIAFQPGDRPEGIRLRGEITAVHTGSNAFSLMTAEGQEVRIHVGDRTQYRSPEGEVQGLEDLEPGMKALVVAVETDEQGLMALLVAAGFEKDRPETFRAIGEITQVNPGQGTISLLTREGEELTFQVIDRTKFRSRDGSIQDIHDLKKGMMALVVGARNEEGDLVALLVAAGNPEDRPGGGQDVDARFLGHIVGLGDRTITLETRDGRQVTVSVDGATVYRSRSGEVDSFDDLEVGMVAAIGAKELGNGQWKAVWVAAGHPKERPDKPRRGAEEAQPAAPLAPEG